ncbi:MAG: hypothetical protein HY335_09720, partial [Deinococcus sp.]|nr:hypothetical protein [Deinococcus sp.]
MEATGKTRAVLAIPGALVSSLLTLGLLRWGLQRVLAPAGAVGQVGTAWILLGATLLLVLGLAWGLGRWLRPGWAPVLGQVVAPLAVGIPPFLLALGFLILDGQWVPGDALVDQLLVALPPALALGLA